jgi:hypothetical protein
MQKLCQKRALEVNKLAKSQMAKAPEPVPQEPMDIGSTFKPSVSLLYLSTPNPGNNLVLNYTFWLQKNVVLGLDCDDFGFGL